MIKQKVQGQECGNQGDVSENFHTPPPQAKEPHPKVISSKDTVSRNNPNISFDHLNLKEDDEFISEDEEDAEDKVDKDLRCPTTKLTKEQKPKLIRPWRNALIVKLFDKWVGYMQLKKRLKTVWSLKGDFALIDIDCDYYIARFTNLDDRHHVMNQGPWLISDNYLTVR